VYIAIFYDKNQHVNCYFRPKITVVSSRIKDVVTTGEFYLENNIPEKARKGSYHNPRLNDDSVRKYKKPFHWGKDSIDNEWIIHWKDYHHHDNNTPNWAQSCYKSTMIIPMTLINNDLSDEFKRRFFENNLDGERTIWGFLCFDHPTINYFDRERDSAIGYIWADLLSLYFISAHIHTELSDTVKGIECSEMNQH